MIADVSDPSNIKNIVWIYPDGPQESLDWLSFTILTHKPSKERTHPKFGRLTIVFRKQMCINSYKSHLFQINNFM